MSRWRQCIHESGHCIVARAFGLDVMHADLSRCRVKGKMRRAHEVLIALAAKEAETEFLGNSTLHAGDDARMSKYQLAADVDLYLRKLARRMVVKYKSEIERFAADLYAEGEHRQQVTEAQWKFINSRVSYDFLDAQWNAVCAAVSEIGV